MGWYGWWGGYGWWWWWIAFVVLFLILPLGYGWGYRGWGPPRYQRRRPPTIDTEPPVDELGWGVAGCLVWFFIFLAVLWFFSAWSWGTRWY